LALGTPAVASLQLALFNVLPVALRFADAPQISQGGLRLVHTALIAAQTAPRQLAQGDPTADATSKAKPAEQGSPTS
jgi:hypothetical protein